MIFDSDSDQKILNPPWSDKYLKSTKMEGDDMNNLRHKLETVVEDAISFGSNQALKNPTPYYAHVSKQSFIDDKVDRIFLFISQELKKLFKESK